MPKPTSQTGYSDYHWRSRKQFERLQVDIRGANPSPGNQKGGLTTLEEKSLGAIMKAGHATINQVVKYGEIATEKG